MSTITLQHLLDACSPGGASVLTSVTPLEPAAGPHASVAPAKFLEGKGRTAKPVFAYERRFWDREAVTVPEQPTRGRRVSGHRGPGSRAGPYPAH